MPDPLTLTAYAKRRGVSVVAVSKAVSSGRLDKSVVRDDRGQPKIADPELADREWAANTRAPGDRQPAGRARGPAELDDHKPQPAEPQARERASEPRVEPQAGAIPNLNTSRAIRAAAAARREAAQADQAELDLAERRGELIDADDARCERIEAFSLVKTRLLAVPSQVAQRLPHVAIEVEPVIDELIREALQELSERARSSEGG